MKSSPQDNKKRKRSAAGFFSERRHRLAFRSQRGSILPLIAFLLALTVAFLALTVDVMRTIHTVDKVQSAVEAAALAAMYKAGNPDGTAFDAASRAAINDELTRISNWNQAPAGPTSSSNPQETNISFDTSSTEFYPNPQDSGSPQEFFLRVTGRRDGADSLTMMFLPAIFAFNSFTGLPVPPGISQVSPYRTVEVISQPAARIGAATTAQPYAKSAAFPFVLAQSEFEMPVNNDNTVVQPIDLVASTGYGSTVSRLKGGFVNTAHTGTGSYFGTASGAGDVDELTGLLEFFAANSSGSTPASGIVERQSRLRLFDPASAEFRAAIQNSNLKARLLEVDSTRFQIVPIVGSLPANGGLVANAAVSVVGFARVKLTFSFDSENKVLASATIGESAPVANATIADGRLYTDNGRMNPGTGFFAQRILSVKPLELSTRRRGIVMAPSLTAFVLPKIEPHQGAP